MVIIIRVNNTPEAMVLPVIKRTNRLKKKEMFSQLIPINLKREELVQKWPQKLCRISNVDSN